ncbi:hypothetical protein C5167_020213 [Papaver somniferum]|uniref:Dolichyl-diphosphooligosaccharide-protein glycosyltransferase subunit OST5 n=1 Tax=Papaver somniferum TaxID=3469 RepID=A0A4Y7IUH1_PAPSO|nr:hypothetical protein C5167_020213 [Papaver somniferum]
MAGSVKSISSPVPVTLFPTLAALLLTIGLILTASFFISGCSFKRRAIKLLQKTNWEEIVFQGFLLPSLTKYEATSSRKTRSVAKELITGTVASVFLGFGSLFLLLASGVYV